MSPENPKHILTAHDLSNLRTLQSVATTAIPVSGNSSYHHSNNNTTTNMVLSTIPLDGHAVVIQQSHLLPTTTAASIAATQQQQQQRSSATTTSNGFNSNTLQSRTTTNNISNLIATATLQPTTKAAVLNSSNSSNMSTNNNGMHSIPASSKYVFLQQNGNGQYTTYEGTTSTTGNNVGNIVLLATEPMELSTSGGSDTHVVTGDNDEELRPLSWLNDKNLIKGIVTTSNGNAATAAGANKRQISSNICIVNANGTHEYIEELPPHVACEEHVTTIGSSSNNNSTTTMSLHDMPETQITTLSVSDFQQQFISSNNIGGNKRNSSSSNNNSNSHQQLANLANFALAQEAAKDQQHIYNNIATLGATTTVHVGPSGTTTVVEYKSNSNFMPTQRQLINGISCSSNNVATSASSNSSTNTVANTTIMAANNSNNNHNHNNNYVPSTTSTASSANYASTCTPHTTPLKQTITLPNNVNTVVVSANSVVNGNNTTNTYYQKQSNNNNNNSSSSTSHHPHKKYLREKMNGLDQTAGHNSSGSNSAATSVVSSPASSSSSASGSSNSTLSSSLSTGAINGANSPVSKSSSSTYYTLIGGSGGGGAAGLAAGGGSNSNSGGGGSINYTNAFVTANTTATSQPHNNNYTILNQNQHIISSPAMSSPESSTKDYYTVQQHQQQQQQQQHHHIALKSPTSYSSYENDSLKDFEISTTNSGRLTTSTPQQQHYHQQQPQSHSPTPIHHHQKASAMSPTSSTSSSTAAAAPSTPQKQKHPNNVPYDPLVHTHNKPPYSFSSLIFMAIEGSMEKALPVKEIYAWIVQHFPYFKTAPTGWKNSVRHNLSLNKSFVKVEKAPNMGKGSLWRVEQQQRQNLIQALTRSPFFPNSAVDKINLKNTGGYDAIDGNATISTLTNGNSTSAVGASGGLLSAGNKSCIDARFDARLFPKLSKVFKDMEEHNSLNDNGSGGGVSTDMADDDIPSDYSTTNNNNHSNSNKYQYNPATPMQQQQQQQQQSAVSAGSNLNSYDNIERLARDCGADSIDDVNAATAMLALKHGPKVFAETFQNGAPVITSSPSEDHTYSAGGGGGVGVGTVNTLTNGNSTSNGAATNGIANGQHVVCGDNQSNCASSDAAYESSEENHNITPEELADQQRHRDGVDALLSLSLSSFMDGNSPIKRPPSNTVEEEHISSCLENITPSIGVGKMALMSVNAVTNQHASAVYHLHQHQQHPQQHHHHHSILDEGYNTQSYYGSNNNSNSCHYMASPSTPKKPKPLRNLRAKIKRKPTWIR